MFRKQKDTAEEKLLERVFTPKQNGFVGHQKPRVLILKSSYDVGALASSVRYNDAKRLAEDRGCVVLNSGELIYDVETGDLGNVKIIADKFKNFNQPIIIWLESHGAPGWLFGGEPNFHRESQAAHRFAACLYNIEKSTGLNIEAILLHSCFSATEIVNRESGEYLNSSARLLSILMPEKSVIGFIGRNSGAKVTQVFRTETDTTLQLSLVAGSIVFKDGNAIEYRGENPLYLDVVLAYMQPFILQSCGITPNLPSRFLLCPAKESKLTKECFATRQEKEYRSMAKELNPGNPPTPGK